MQPVPSCPQDNMAQWLKKHERVKQLPMCECIFEPRGDHGLEGYSYKIEYRFELVQEQGKQPYYRVWPNAEGCPEYWESCSPSVFKRFFLAIA